MKGKAFLVLLITNLLLGGLSVDYILSWFNKNIGFGWDMFLGLLFGELTMPVALFGWILKTLGVF